MNKVEVVAPGPLQRQARGRGQADQGLDSGAQHLLNQLKAATAGNDRRAASQIDVLPYQRPDQFIEGVVSANVFAAHQQLALAVHINSRVHGAAVLA